MRAPTSWSGLVAESFRTAYVLICDPCHQKHRPKDFDPNYREHAEGMHCDWCDYPLYTVTSERKWVIS